MLKKSQKLLLKRPSKASHNKIQEWKRKVKSARDEEDISYNTKMKALREQWTRSEWRQMQTELEKLSLKQLQLLVTRVGIQFEGGNSNVRDRKQMTASEQFILVLDEVPKSLLMSEYKKILLEEN